MKIVIEKNQVVKDRHSNNSTNSDTLSSNQKENPRSLKLICCYECLTDRREEVLVGKFSQIQFSTKLNAKSISWLITTSWVNNFDDYSLYLSIVLFYYYKANKNIEKSKLELLLLSLIYISSKKNRGTSLRIYQAQKLSSKEYSVQQIVEMEAEILSAADFNLQFDLSISQLLWKEDLEHETLSKLLFLIEIHLLTSCQILFNKKKLDSFLNFIKRQDKQLDDLPQLLHNLNLKEAEIIKNKYASKFNVQEFIQKYSLKSS